MAGGRSLITDHWPLITRYSSLFPAQRGQLRKQLVLALGEVGGNLDDRAGVQVAALLGAAQSGHPLSAQAEDLAGLRLRRDGEDDLAAQCGYVRFTAQQRRVQIHREVRVHVVALAAELRMRGNGDDEIQVALGLPRAALAADADFGPRPGPGRDGDFDAAVIHLERAPGPAESFFQRNLDELLQILAADALARSESLPRAETPAEQAVEEVGKPALAKHIVQVATRSVDAGPAGRVPLAEVKTAARPPRAFPLGIARAEPVVLGALLRVAEDFVGLVDLLELVLGLFIAGVFVRVILLRQLAEGALDFFFGGVLAHAQDVVIVFVFHRRQPMMRG